VYSYHTDPDAVFDGEERQQHRFGVATVTPSEEALLKTSGCVVLMR